MLSSLVRTWASRELRSHFPWLPGTAAGLSICRDDVMPIILLNSQKMPQGRKGGGYTPEHSKDETQLGWGRTFGYKTVK